VVVKPLPRIVDDGSTKADATAIMIFWYALNAAGIQETITPKRRQYKVDLQAQHRRPQSSTTCASFVCLFSLRRIFLFDLLIKEGSEGFDD
jgi:hypothetical protein